MRIVKFQPTLLDSLSKESFFLTLKKHIQVMKNSKLVKDPMIFGILKIEKNKYISSLENILEHENNWLEYIQQKFDFYEVYGKNEWGEVMSTGYYEPHVRGSHQMSSEFSQPLYSTPKDLKGSWVKYYTRKEIDSDNKLRNQNLELAWLDPIDAYFIQIQGSGLVEFEDGAKVRFGFDHKNGHPYGALGKYLQDVIPKEKMSMQTIKKYLKTLNHFEQQEVFNKNPSYVFFRKLENETLTYAGMEVSPGRTIASDLRYFPKGALAFLDIEEPQFENISEIEPKSWLRLPRLVFDQDTGGAIKGGGRVDLYFGSSESDAQKAGVMKQNGKLYYLVPKNENNLL